MKRAFVLFWALGLLLLPIAAAFGGANLPIENHYMVYRATPTPIVMPLTLIDQFGTITVQNLVLEQWANPALKKIPGTNETYPPVDGTAFQAWWRISVPQPSRSVIATDQFGSWPLTLGNAVFLLNPARGDVVPPYPALPVRNHYLCYEVIGALTVAKPVILYDQWWSGISVVLVRSKFFCNPVEKRHADGTFSPIVDASTHLNCYSFDTVAIEDHPDVGALDQFGYRRITVYDSNCLCVPALKEMVVSTKPTTWGQIKALYR